MLIPMYSVYVSRYHNCAQVPTCNIQRLRSPVHRFRGPQDAGGKFRCTAALSGRALLPVSADDGLVDDAGDASAVRWGSRYRAD